MGLEKVDSEELNVVEVKIKIEQSIISIRQNVGLGSEETKQTSNWDFQSSVTDPIKF